MLVQIYWIKVVHELYLTRDFIQIHVYRWLLVGNSNGYPNHVSLSYIIYFYSKHIKCISNSDSPSSTNSAIYIRNLHTLFNSRQFLFFIFNVFQLWFDFFSFYLFNFLFYFIPYWCWTGFIIGSPNGTKKIYINV